MSNVAAVEAHLDDNVVSGDQGTMERERECKCVRESVLSADVDRAGLDEEDDGRKRLSTR